jgi:dolichol-phosphate mannosyltransferase
MKTVVVIPTYNEADNLPTITAELLELGIEGLEILFVDDASPDGTGQIADDLAQRYPGRLHVMHRQGKLGLGTAYVQGFTWALEKFLELIKDYDVVVGSRYVPGGQLDERWGVGRWFLSWWANSIWTRLILGVRSKDATAGFKCWRSSALEQIGLERIRSNGYVFQVEMAYVSEKIGLRVLETPIYFEDRRIGQSKMTVPVKFEAAARVFEIRWRHRHVQSASRAIEAKA